MNDDELETTNPTTDDVPRLAANGMDPFDIVATTLDQSALTGAAVTSLTGTTSGRNFVTYLVECALGPSQSITTTGATPYTFTGLYNVAPGWTSGALSQTDRRWVSACVLARANSYKTVITISMRGNNTALTTTSNELHGYGVQEASFYGDIFAGNNERHGCSDVDTINRPTFGDLPKRVCSREYPTTPGTTYCGYEYDGACAAHCTTDAYGYSSCNDTTGTAWNQVVRVWVYGI